MLRINRQEPEAIDQTRGGDEFSVETLIQVFRRQRWVIAGVAGAIAGLAALYCAIATPKYSAEAQLLMDTSQTQAFSGVSGMPEIMDGGMVDSQVEIVKSERIAKAVIKEVGRVQPDYIESLTGGGGFSASGLLGTVLPFLFNSQPLSEYEHERRQINNFAESLNVKRIGRSYVISITFESPIPKASAAIANQVAESYIVDQLESKFQATRRASVWLQERITELRDQSVAADRAVQEFKIKNDMVDTGKGLVSDQQLGELNSQLLAARTDVAEAKARFQRVQDILKQGNADGFTDEVVSDVLKSDVVTRLRGQLLDTQKRADEWTKRYGADHIAVVNLRSEIEGLKRALYSELNRIAETYRSDLDIARARESSLAASFDELVSKSKKNSRAQVDLRELESTAETYRSLYENFLQRFMQATQQQSFPITEARVITDASQPLDPSKPRTKLIVLAGLLLGLAAGTGVGYWREWSNRSFRQPVDVEQYLGLDCLGVLPRLPAAPASPSHVRRSAFESTSGPFRQVVTEPLSRFTETLRSVKVSADISIIGSAIKVIGFTSTLPKEGKSTVSANFAQLIAHSGSKCILVDGDLRNPTLSRNLAPDQEVGLLQLLSGSATLEEASVVDPVTGLRFIPSVVPKQLVHTHEIIASEQMKRTISMLKQHADYIVVDFPPLAPIVDTVASAPFVDGYVYILDWGSSNRDLVINTLKNSRSLYEKILGCLLNKADLAALKRLESYGGAYHYYKYHAEYGERA